MISMHHPRYLLSFIGLCLVLLLAACGSPSGTTAPPGTRSGSQSAHVTQTTSQVIPAGKPGPIVRVVTNVAMPPTQTSCPAPGTGRAAIMRPLALGSHPNIAYLFNQTNLRGTPTFGELKRYDVVTGSKTILVHLAHAQIVEAQVSGDGQWLLFVAEAPGKAMLQMVRMDGQGLQTLYCAQPSSIRATQWSPDHSLIVFSAGAFSAQSRIDLFTMASGTVQVELSSTNANLSYVARTWADNTRVYLTTVLLNSPTPVESLSLLDTKKGGNQHDSDLLQVIQPSQPQYCWDFDSDYATTKLVTSQCRVLPTTCVRGVQQGPSTITTRPINGGSQQTIYSNARYAVNQVRFQGYSSTSLLLTVDNQNFGANVPVDSSQNGLWRMNTDGSGLVRLSNGGANRESTFNRFSQYPWSNVSRGGSMYVIQVSDVASPSPVTRLYVGSLSGGSPTSFAYANMGEGTVEVAGWTAM
jgi:eukaryotic-like serine/threonine-protein kinase